MIELKRKIFEKLEELLTDRAQTMHQQLNQLQKDSAGSGKSSMGDKYETTREMLKQEEEKIGQQLARCKKDLQLVLSQKENVSHIAQSGSLVKSKDQYFMLLIGLGPLEIDEIKVFVISPASPIGQSMLKKKTGQKFYFNRQEQTIDEIF